MTLKPCPFCDGEALGIDHPPHKHHFVKMPDHPGSYTIECVKCSVGLIATTQAEAEAAWNQRTSGVTDGMVNRFLSWRLPQDFGPDAGITFKPINHPDALTHLWPVGTNLLTAVQTRQMLEHVVAVPPEVAPTFLAAAIRFAKANAHSDHLDAVYDEHNEENEAEYEAADREYNASKKAFGEAYKALPSPLGTCGNAAKEKA